MKRITFMIILNMGMSLYPMHTILRLIVKDAVQSTHICYLQKTKKIDLSLSSPSTNSDKEPIIDKGDTKNEIILRSTK